jgi:hypothetical protein
MDVQIENSFYIVTILIEMCDRSYVGFIILELSILIVLCESILHIWIGFKIINLILYTFSSSVVLLSIATFLFKMMVLYNKC